jgi:hypothetical protein
MAKAPKRTPKPGRGKKASAEFTGTAHALVQIEVRITDDSYEVDLLADDIDKKRAWFEPRADAQGWFKLVYSADGPTGDPWIIGKIRFAFDANDLDSHFGNLTGVKFSKAMEE